MIAVCGSLVLCLLTHAIMRKTHPVVINLMLVYSSVNLVLSIFFIADSLLSGLHVFFVC